MGRITCQRHEHILWLSRTIPIWNDISIEWAHPVSESLTRLEFIKWSHCILSLRRCFFPPLSYWSHNSGVLPSPLPTHLPAEVLVHSKSWWKFSVSRQPVLVYLAWLWSFLYIDFSHTLISLDWVAPRLLGNCVQWNSREWERKGRFWNSWW